MLDLNNNKIVKKVYCIFFVNKHIRVKVIHLFWDHRTYRFSRDLYSALAFNYAHQHVDMCDSAAHTCANCI